MLSQRRYTRALGHVTCEARGGSDRCDVRADLPSEQKRPQA